jgi:hypothetical protein
MLPGLPSNFLRFLGRSCDRPLSRLVGSSGPPFGVSKSRTRWWRVERSADPFLGSPANFRTRAPNFSKLGQTGGARQDLVRKSESTTKCGDNGEESGGGKASIRDSKGIRKGSQFPVTTFHARKAIPDAVTAPDPVSDRMVFAGSGTGAAFAGHAAVTQ